LRTNSEYLTRRESRRVADLRRRAEDLERELSEARDSLERELEEAEPDADGPPELSWDEIDWDAEDVHHATALAAPAFYAGAETAPDDGPLYPGGYEIPGEDRTETMVSHGRRSSYRRRLPRRRHVIVIGAAIAALVIVLVVVLEMGGASWPASVATVQAQMTRACHNPDVASEPGQVNFACAKDTRQILWVFALLTSHNDPKFSDGRTGRLGLEPITPAQGGVIAWSLNLHRPYDPLNAVDSIEVAARAINNIIGGATLTGSNGRPVVQSGLESSSANCLRYTGSAALKTRAGYPSVCARPVTLAGQGELVADVYQKWIVGAAPTAAQDAAVLFENSTNPGDPQVQAILKRISSAHH
jgi:hypothetical protein